MTLKQRVVDALHDHAQQRRWLSGLLVRVARVYLDGYDNYDYAMARNGEVRLLRRLAPTKPTVVFDVGANHGEWTLAALEQVPTAQVHAFEISPTTAFALQNRLGLHQRCVINSFGLGEDDATVPLEFFPGRDELTTRLRDLGVHALEPEIISGRIRRGRDYCAERGLEHIDLLKIDVEGTEHLVMQGFGELITSGKVAVIQFEYGMANITSRYLLKDFHAMLGGAGYEVGKLFPWGVRFSAYSPTAEDFRGPNFVAVHRSRPDIRAAVAG